MEAQRPSFMTMIWEWRVSELANARTIYKASKAKKWSKGSKVKLEGIFIFIICHNKNKNKLHARYHQIPAHDTNAPFLECIYM